MQTIFSIVSQGLNYVLPFDHHHYMHSCVYAPLHHMLVSGIPELNTCLDFIPQTLPMVLLSELVCTEFTAVNLGCLLNVFSRIGVGPHASSVLCIYPTEILLSLLSSPFPTTTQVLLVIVDSCLFSYRFALSVLLL